jgi:hypothetical protein
MEAVNEYDKADGSKDLDQLRIWRFVFESGDFWIDEKGRAWFNYARKSNLTECNVGEEVRLCCQVTYLDKIGSDDREVRDGNLGDPDLHNLKITAKITSSKTGDVKYLTLLEPVNIGYPLVLGAPVSYFGRLHISISDVVDETNTKYATLKVSPDGDIVIAEIEIEGSSRKATASLIVKGIENE